MDEYIEREALLERIDGIYDCSDMVFEPHDHCCRADDCASCKWRETKNAIRRIVANFRPADVAPVQRWIPVTERLPEEKDRYLTVSIEPWFGTTVVDTMRWSGVWMYDGRQTEATVTHWMPLPEPPKEEQT